MFVIRVTQLARELGVHRNTVANWIKCGKLKASPTVGQKYLIAKEDLCEFCRNTGISERLIETLAQSSAYAVPISQPVHSSTLSNESEGSMSDTPTDSTMVVGGGIAGIQAALDLADSGYYEYMVEKSSGIGDSMAKSEGSMSDTPIGSIMVIGGGIAGIQAALDLADSGYYVYMVEKSSGIGGSMAQLDKTFPTNDCAM